MQLLVPFQPRIKGGGVLTTVADRPGQAIFWELVSFDLATEEEGPALGSLRWPVTKADQAGLAVNLYLAPTGPELAGKIDRVKVSAA